MKITPHTPLEKLEMINSLVENDLVEEFCSRSHSEQKDMLYKTSESKQMAQLLGKIYSISHTIYCNSCDKSLKMDTIINQKNRI